MISSDLTGISLFVSVSVSLQPFLAFFEHLWNFSFRLTGCVQTSEWNISVLLIKITFKTFITL